MPEISNKNIQDYLTLGELVELFPFIRFWKDVEFKSFVSWSPLILKKWQSSSPPEFYHSLIQEKQTM